MRQQRQAFCQHRGLGHTARVVHIDGTSRSPLSPALAHILAAEVKAKERAQPTAIIVAL